MKQNRTLRLRSERLAELTSAQLNVIAAGTVTNVAVIGGTTPTMDIHCEIKGLTTIFEPAPTGHTHCDAIIKFQTG